MPRKLLAVALVAGFAAVAIAAEAPKMRILSFTGQIQIKVGNEVIGVVPGGKMPDIPAGAEITVVSGEAVMQSGATVVKADAGDSFVFSAGATGNVEIASTGEKGSISVIVGGSEAKLEKGQKVEVAAPTAAGGATQIKAVTGNIEVTTAGKTETVAAGSSMNAAVAPTTTTTTPTTTTETTPTTTTTTPTTTETTQTTTDTTGTTTDTTISMPPPPPPNVQQDQVVAPVSGSTP